MALFLSAVLCPRLAIAQGTGPSVIVSVEEEFTRRPTDMSVVYGDVYGTVSFNSDLRRAEGIRAFLDTLISQKFGLNAEGSFLVTLAVSTGPSEKPLVERPILTATRKAKQFLWITTQESVAGQIDINGTVLNGIIVKKAVNNLRVSIKVYKSDKLTFDTKSYADLLNLADQARIAASLLELPELVTGNSDTVKKLLETALSRENSQELTLATEMSFIAVAGLALQPPNKQRFTINSRSSTVNHTFHIDVYFQTLPSAVGVYDTSKTAAGTYKGFTQWALPTKFMKRALVTVGDAPIPISDMIQKSGPKEIATAWTMLNTAAYDAAKNGNMSVEHVCRKLYELLGNVLTERDAVGLYWDILHELKVNLSKTAGAKDCVEAKKPLFLEHGLEVESLSAISN